MMVTSIIPFMWEEPNQKLALPHQSSLQLPFELSPSITECQTWWSVLMIGSRHRWSGTHSTLAGGKSLKDSIENLWVNSVMTCSTTHLTAGCGLPAACYPGGGIGMVGSPTQHLQVGSSGLPMLC